MGVDGISFGEAADRLCEVPDVAWVDRHGGKTRGRNGRESLALKATGGFHEHEVGDRQLAQPRYEVGDSLVGIGHRPRLLGRQDRHVEGGLRDVDSNEQFLGHGCSFLLREEHGSERLDLANTGSRPTQLYEL
jgi:hypothetical protein